MKYSESQWVEEYLTGYPAYWDDLVVNKLGRKIDELEDGELKRGLQSFVASRLDVEKILSRYNYQAG